MIIEVTGVPACGKTTYINRLLENNETCLEKFSFETVSTFLHVDGLPKILRRGLCELFLYVVFLLSVIEYRLILRFSVLCVLKTKENPLIKLNIIRNIMLRIARHEFVRKHLRGKRIIFDEGLVHMLFNIADYGAFEVNHIHKLLAMINKTTHAAIILIDHRKANIDERLKKRRHKRLSNSKYHRIAFMRVNEEIFQVIKANLNKFMNYDCLDPDEDINPNRILVLFLG